MNGDITKDEIFPKISSAALTLEALKKTQATDTTVKVKIT